MTDIAAGFLHALHEDADDSTTRAIFADWLEDRSDPRAGWFRQTAALRVGVPDLDDREARWLELERTFAAWLATLAPRVRRLGRIRLHGGQLRLDTTTRKLAGFGVDAIRTLLLELGIETIRLDPDPAGVVGLLARSKLASVGSLDLNNHVFSPEHWGEFVAQRLPGLVRLDLSNTGLRDVDLVGLVRRGLFARMAWLDLRNNRLNGPAVLALLDAEVAPNLRYLGLHGNPLRDDVFNAWYTWRCARDPRTRRDGLATRRLTRLGLEMRLISAGTYKMGTNLTGAGPGERPSHRVRITRPFYLSAFPTTQAQMARAIGITNSHFRTADVLDPTGESPCLPVEEVGRELVAQFRDRVMAEPGEQASGLVYRLPTEAEWEYAARAQEPSRFEYSGSRTLRGCDSFNHDGPVGARRTTPVGSYLPNAWGLHDVHGNVWDWVSDFYGANYYSESPEDDPTGPLSGTHGLLRGGSWFNRAMICRITYRCPTTLPAGSFCIGFRLAASVGGA